MVRLATAGAAVALLSAVASGLAANAEAPSFDCTKAATAAEKIVCGDHELSQADAKMAAAYARLKRTETPESFATVQESQRKWLAYLTASCKANGPLPAEEPKRAAIKDCLTDDHADRADRLHAIQVVKAGALALEPRMRFFSRPNSHTSDSDIYPWMSGGHQAAAFNAHVCKTLGLDKRRIDDENLFAFTNLPADMTLYARRTYSVARFDARVVSLQIQTYDYTGGAHEVIGEASLNWDVTKARPLALSEMFAKPWRKFITDYCMQDLHRQFAARGASGPDRSAVTSVIADRKSWLFAKDHATVHFTVYSIASFADGEFDVEIPYKVLQPYLRPDAPVLSP